MFSAAASVKAEDGVSEVVITKEMEEEEMQLVEKGEKKEEEIMKKVFVQIFFFNIFENCNGLVRQVWMLLMPNIDIRFFFTRLEKLRRRKLMTFASRDCNTCWRKVTYIPNFFLRRWNSSSRR